MQQVKWGILGTGEIANKFACAVTNADGAELVAVASRRAESAKAFAEKYGIPVTFSSYEDLINYGGVDAVYIALPHSYHIPYAKRLMQAGKNVLSEKPVATNRKELAQAQSLVAESGLFMMEAMWTRFLPAIAKIKDIIAAGVIGHVLEVSADFCYAQPDLNHHVYKREYAGGSLLDVGIYGLTFASIFLGDEIADIKSAAYKANGIEERLNLLLTYKSGAIARISSAITLYKPADGYIYGSKGYIHVPDFYKAENFEVVTDDGGHTETYCVPFKGNGFEEEIEECNRCILAGKSQSDVHPLSQSAVIMEIMDTVREQLGIVYDAD